MTFTKKYLQNRSQYHEKDIEKHELERTSKQQKMMGNLMLSDSDYKRLYRKAKWLSSLDNVIFENVPIECLFIDHAEVQKFKRNSTNFKLVKRFKKIAKELRKL